MKKEKTNKISIYLLKEGISIEEGLLKKIESPYPNKQKDESPYPNKQLGNNILYYVNRPQSEPSWKKKFFNNELNDLSLYNQSSSGVYFIKVTVENNCKRIFIVAFGYGHTMIDKIQCVNDFGLKVVLNSVSNDSIRKVSKRNLSSDPKNTIEQLGKIGNIADFVINFEEDLVEEITGKPKQDSFLGKNKITGKLETLTVSAKVDVSTIEKFLQETFKCYKKEDYKDHFSFIDNFKAIKDVQKWDDKLLEKLKNQDNSSEDIKLWMSIPEIIDWADVEGFSYNNKKENLHDDIDLESFKDFLSKNQEGLEGLDLKKLKNKKVTAFRSSTNMEYTHWSCYQCFYCEITEQDKTIILVNGKWYEITNSFVKEVQSRYDNIIENSKSAQINLIECNKEEHENTYNKRLKDSNIDYILMDRKMVHRDKLSSIELCDIYDKKQKRFIHIKNYHGSSALSHLFAQGRVSGQLFLFDKDFREKAQEKENNLGFSSDKPDASKYEIIFGIISKSKDELDLPFFSKVNLRHDTQQLTGFGFKSVYLIKIQRNEDATD